MVLSIGILSPAWLLENRTSSRIWWMKVMIGWIHVILWFSRSFSCSPHRHCQIKQILWDVNVYSKSQNGRTGQRQKKPVTWHEKEETYQNNFISSYTHECKYRLLIPERIIHQSWNFKISTVRTSRSKVESMSSIWRDQSVTKWWFAVSRETVKW